MHTTHHGVWPRTLPQPPASNQRTSLVNRFSSTAPTQGPISGHLRIPMQCDTLAGNPTSHEVRPHASGGNLTEVAASRNATAGKQGGSSSAKQRDEHGGQAQHSKPTDQRSSQGRAKARSGDGRGGSSDKDSSAAVRAGGGRSGRHCRQGDNKKAQTGYRDGATSTRGRAGGNRGSQGSSPRLSEAVAADQAGEVFTHKGDRGRRGVDKGSKAGGYGIGGLEADAEGTSRQQSEDGAVPVARPQPEEGRVYSKQRGRGSGGATGHRGSGAPLDGHRATGARGKGQSSRGGRASRKGGHDSLAALMADVEAVQGQVVQSQAVEFIHRMASIRRQDGWEAAKQQVLAVAWEAGVASFVTTLEPAEVRQVLQAMTKLKVEDGRTLHALADRAAHVVGSMSAFEVSYTLWALEELGIQDRQRRGRRYMLSGGWAPDPLVARFMEVLDTSSNPLDCSNFLCACHRLGVPLQAHFSRVVSHFVALPGEQAPHHYSNILWAGADGGAEPPRELGALLEGLADTVGAEPQHLVKAVAAADVWQQRSGYGLPLHVVYSDGSGAPISEAVMRLIDLLLPKLGQGGADSAKLVANVLYSATQHEGWVAARQVKPLLATFVGSVGSATTRNCANVLCAVAEVGYDNEQVVKACASRFARVWRDATPWECASSLQALAKLRVADPAVVGVFATTLIQVVDRAEVVHCNTALKALASLDARDSKVVEALRIRRSAALRKEVREKVGGEHLGPVDVREGVDSLDAVMEDAGSMVSGERGVTFRKVDSLLQRLARLQHRSEPPRWETARKSVTDMMWKGAVLSRMESLTARDVRKAVDLANRLRIRDNQALQELGVRATVVAGDMTAYDASYTLWGLQKLGVLQLQPEAIIRQFLHILPEANAMDCANFVYACHKLGWQKQGDYTAVVSHFVTLPAEGKSPHQYANILRALSKQGAAPPAELSQLLEGFVGLVGGNATGQAMLEGDSFWLEISTVLLALHQWQAQQGENAPLQLTRSDGSALPAAAPASKLVQLFAQRISEADAQALSNVAQACSKWGWATKEQLQPVFAQFCSIANGATAQGCANMLQAAAGLGYYNEQVVKVCASRFERVRRDATPWLCVSCLQALVQLRVTQPEVVGVFTASLLQVVDRAGVDHCNAALTALASLDVRDSTVVDALLNRQSAVKQKSVPGMVGDDNSRPLDLQGGVDTVDALMHDVASMTNGTQGVSFRQVEALQQRLTLLQRRSEQSRWDAARQAVIDATWKGGVMLGVESMTPGDVRKAVELAIRLRICDKQTLQWLGSQALRVAGTMTPYDASYTLWGLQNLGVQRYSPEPVIRRFLHTLPQANGVDCSNFVWACHKLGWENPGDYTAVVKHFSALAAQNKSSQQYANILWALSERGIAPPAELGMLLEEFVELFRGSAKSQAESPDDGHGSRAIATVLLSLQKWQAESGTDAHLPLTRGDGSALSVTAAATKLAQLFAERVSEADVQALSNVAWACSKWGWTSKQQLQPVFAQFSRKSGDATSQACSNVLWAAAKLGHRDVYLVQAVTSRFSQVQHSATPQACSNSLRALASLGIDSERVVGVYTGRLCEVMQQASPQHCANALGALAKLGIRDKPVMDACLARLRDVVRHTTPQDCSNVLGALAMMGLPDDPTCTVLGLRFEQLLGQAAARDCRQLVWALAKLGRNSQAPLARKALHRALVLTEQMVSQDCANLLWGAGMLGVCNQGSAAKLLGRLLQLRSQWRVIDVSQCVFGLWMAGYTHLPPGADQLVGFVVEHLGECDVVSSFSLISGLGGLVGVDDTRLLAVVNHYVSIADSDSMAGRHEVAKVLGRIGYGDEHLMQRLRA